MQFPDILISSLLSRSQSSSHRHQALILRDASKHGESQQFWDQNWLNSDEPVTETIKFDQQCLEPEPTFLESWKSQALTFKTQWQLECKRYLNSARD